MSFVLLSCVLFISLVAQADAFSPSHRLLFVSKPARQLCSATALLVHNNTNGEVLPVQGEPFTEVTTTVNGDTSVASEETNADMDVFSLLAARTAVCLLESEMRRDAIGENSTGRSPAGATNWIDEAGAFALQKAVNCLKIKLPNERTGIDRDEASAWFRWLKAMPAPASINLNEYFRAIVNEIVSDSSLELIKQPDRQEFLSRVACRMILLPSGAALESPLTEPPASLVYGKLLYGGVTRSRLMPSTGNFSNKPPRRVALRTETMARAGDITPAWIMYGGPSRMYEAVDMGPAALLEIVLLPRGNLLENNQKIMTVRGMTWKPQNMFEYATTEEEGVSGQQQDALEKTANGSYSPSSLSGKDRNDAFRKDFKSSVGGLQTQIDAIVRRVLDGRVIRPADDLPTHDDGDSSSQQLSTASLEAEELAMLGLSAVRGLLLYGPPGTGKTLLAREISRALRARSPKIVSAPELLDRWVGGSEKLVRGLFADAEAELAACNGDATKSALHVIVIDEIDAVFRKRSSSEDTGEATRSSVVNQILAKLDGVQAIPNVLLIGMTNRKELLDEALLRPGRLEVQVEIPLPDKNGRREILAIHFGALRRKGRLSMPLCCALDGVPFQYFNDPLEVQNETRKKRRAIVRALNKVAGTVPGLRSSFDLASDYATGRFSGADIAGLVRCAGSLALARSRKDGSGVDGLLITLDDVKQALLEVKE
jgi:vesicle-fusing ATPase